jgi:hypothetical protein
MDALEADKTRVVTEGVSGYGLSLAWQAAQEFVVEQKEADLL